MPNQEFKNIKRILIIRLRYIGDVLLTLPAVRAVKEKFPESQISYLLNPGTGVVLENNPLVDEIIEYDYEKSLSFLNRLRKQRFDMAIQLDYFDRGAIACYMSGARYRLGPDSKGQGFIWKKYLYTHLAHYPDSMKHKVEQYLGVVQDFGMDTRDLTTPVHLFPEEKSFVDQLFKREQITEQEIIIHCHPVARFSEKQWGFEKMARVIDYLGEKAGYRVIITSSSLPDDRVQMNEIKKYIQSKPVILVGETTFRQCAAIAGRASLYFGLDNGIMHIAAGMGTPVVALFGSTSVIHWQPWGEGHTVITDQSFDQPYRHQEPNGSGHSPFLEQLQVDDVIQVLDRKLPALTPRIK